MDFEVIQDDEMNVAVATGDEKVLIDVQSALDLLTRAKYDVEADRIAVPKELISDDFFVLSTGVAGEILQKFINYGGKIAIYGDFTGYTSKPLQDFMRESNKGSDIFFTSTKEEAVKRLQQAAPIPGT